MCVRRTLVAALAALGLAAHAGLSHGALVTVVGTNFDVTYDDTQLGLFSAPTLVGDTLFFTFNSFVAESLNGVGLVTTNSTMSGLVLTAKGNYQFGAFDLAEFGDYKLNGTGSSVGVTGQLRAFNTALSITTQTSSNLAVNPLTPLTINDGALHDWNASAHIDSTTAPVPPLFGVATNVILSNPKAVGMAIENQLSAFTDPASTSTLRQAFVEKKFAGVQMTVSDVTAVPLPPAALLLLAGFGPFAASLRRKRQAST